MHGQYGKKGTLSVTAIKPSTESSGNTSGPSNSDTLTWAINKTGWIDQGSLKDNVPTTLYWDIVVNPQGDSLQNVKIVDTLGDGQNYVDGSATFHTIQYRNDGNSVQTGTVEDATVTVSGDQITFNLGDIDSPVEITYQTSILNINENAANIWNNSAKITADNPDKNWTKTEDSAAINWGTGGTVQSYNGKLEIIKVDANDHSQFLPGAEFELKNEDGTINRTGITTDENGKVSVGNLPDGKYQLIETKAPEGYQLDSIPVDIVVSEDNNHTATATISDKPIVQSSVNSSSSSSSKTSSSRIKSNSVKSSSLVSSSSKSVMKSSSSSKISDSSKSMSSASLLASSSKSSSSLSNESSSSLSSLTESSSVPTDLSSSATETLSSVNVGSSSLINSVSSSSIPVTGSSSSAVTVSSSSLVSTSTPSGSMSTSSVLVPASSSVAVPVSSSSNTAVSISVPTTVSHSSATTVRSSVPVVTKKSSSLVTSSSASSEKRVSTSTPIVASKSNVTVNSSEQPSSAVIKSTVNTNKGQSQGMSNHASSASQCSSERKELPQTGEAKSGILVAAGITMIGLGVVVFEKKKN